MTTIKDVAKLAGVSISTVSHVLNSTRFVSEEVAMKVKRAIDELEYKPSALARSLKTSKTKTLGMLTSSNANPFFAEVIHGVEATCYELGYHLVLCNFGQDDQPDIKKQASYLTTLAEKRVDGLLIMSAHSSDQFFRTLEELTVPLVILDCHAPVKNADIIMDYPELGGYEATRYLIEQGHRKIGCISGPQTLSPSCDRLAGFHRALHEASIPANPHWTIEGSLTAKSGYQVIEQLIQQDSLPTALFAGNDLMAIGAISALQNKGLRVPEDISIVGYDNIELAAYTSPPLTTIDQPKWEMGALAAKTLIHRLENEKTISEIKTFKSTLVVRKSVKKVH
ncbi:LacI family DNA-binding transcriptional regulator [Endozoicomonas ascidiicola]|uniref:LacI family DNA-binding transcriptional regulator n=1 Tax=Endozoicomonas ascidiicola TaxID=1698521 RepID=UPI00082C4229|nr:substrate-binding domain-containing protein [Endozoicomonas ascidiicola]USN26976.1 substrate-binding domain-containing protein [synthetic construct]